MKNNHESIEPQKMKYIPPTIDCFGAEALTEFDFNTGNDGNGPGSGS